MTNEHYSSLRLFYDLFSVELVERKILNRSRGLYDLPT